MLKIYSFRGGVNGKTLIPYTFNILADFVSFSSQIIHLKNIDVYTFLGGGGSEKVYVLYTHLNVDNYALPLSKYHFIV